MEHVIYLFVIINGLMKTVNILIMNNLEIRIHILYSNEIQVDFRTLNLFSNRTSRQAGVAW